MLTIVRWGRGRMLMMASALGMWMLPVFTSAQSGHLTTQHFFLPPLTGAFPQGSLVQGSDGNFYGTTYYGGPCGPGHGLQDHACGSGERALCLHGRFGWSEPGG